MILKFVFENEIHRCSDPPVDFNQMQPFLANMFRSSLPSQFSLQYVTPEGATVPLETVEDYQTLMSIPSNKPIKVVITEKAVISPAKDNMNEQAKLISAEENIDTHEYEVIGQPVETEEKQVIPSQEEKPKEEEIPLIKPNEKEMSNSAFDKLINDISEVHVVSKIQEQQQEGGALQEDQIKSIVKATLQEQMPFIVSQIKQALIQEGVFEMKPNRASQYQWNQYGYQPYYSNVHQQPYGGVNAPQVGVPQQNRPEVQGNADNEEGVPYYLNKAKEFIEKIPDKANELFEKMPGKAVATEYLEKIPGKATDFVNNIAQRVEGDPFVYCPEGKYKQSTVDKVRSLREWFPEENKKDLLDFVERFPKETPLDQLADIYVNAKKVDQQ